MKGCLSETRQGGHGGGDGKGRMGEEREARGEKERSLSPVKGSWSYTACYRSSEHLSLHLDGILLLLLLRSSPSLLLQSAFPISPTGCRFFPILQAL